MRRCSSRHPAYSSRDLSGRPHAGLFRLPQLKMSSALRTYPSLRLAEMSKWIWGCPWLSLKVRGSWKAYVQGKDSPAIVSSRSSINASFWCTGQLVREAYLPLLEGYPPLSLMPLGSLKVGMRIAPRPGREDSRVPSSTKSSRPSSDVAQLAVCLSGSVECAHPYDGFLAPTLVDASVCNAVAIWLTPSFIADRPRNPQVVPLLILPFL